MAEQNVDLFEDLAKLTGAEYLSDLKSMPYEIIRQQLQTIDPEKYSLSQWQDAVDYLTGKETTQETVEEIYEYLLSY